MSFYSALTLPLIRAASYVSQVVKYSTLPFSWNGGAVTIEERYIIPLPLNRILLGIRRYLGMEPIGDVGYPNLAFMVLILFTVGLLMLLSLLTWRLFSFVSAVHKAPNIQNSMGSVSNTMSNSVPISSTFIANIESKVLNHDSTSHYMVPKTNSNFQEVIQRALLHFKAQESTGIKLTDTQKVEYLLDLLPSDLRSWGFSLLELDDKYFSDFGLFLSAFKDKLSPPISRHSSMRKFINVNQGNQSLPEYTARFLALWKA